MANVDTVSGVQYHVSRAFEVWKCDHWGIEWNWQYVHSIFLTYQKLIMFLFFVLLTGLIVTIGVIVGMSVGGRPSNL
jgi:hypothetical protein